MTAPTDHQPECRAALRREPRQDAFHWRFFVTALSFSLFAIGAIVFGLILLPLVRIIPGRHEVKRIRARNVMRYGLRGYVALMRGARGMDYELEGMERLGRPGQLIVANHPTLLDVVFLLAFVPGANCIVKRGLWRNPLTRNAVTLAEYIMNDPTSAMIDNATRALGEGQAVIVFPEGTRTIPDQPLVFHRGAANVALRAARCVTPVYIRCEPTTLTKSQPWYRIPLRRPRFSLSVGEDLDIDAYRDTPLPAASRALNQRLQRHFQEALARRGHARDAS